MEFLVFSWFVAGMLSYIVKKIRSTVFLYCIVFPG